MSFRYRDGGNLPDMLATPGAKACRVAAEVTLAVMSMLPRVLHDGRQGALDGCVPTPEVRNEGSEVGGTFERGEGA